MLLVQVSEDRDRSNGRPAHATGAPRQPAPVGTAYAEVPALGTSPITGVNWTEVVAALAGPVERHWDETGVRYYSLGDVRDLLPSGKSYSITQVGNTEFEPISAEPPTWADLAADLSYLRTLRAEAAALGLRIEADATCGDVLNVAVDARPCLVLAGGLVVLAGGHEDG